MHDVTQNQEGFKVGYAAIVGRPNVGKSTLLNSILDFKVAAVTRKAQTTRHQIRGILTGPTHQIIFMDTPGLIDPKYKLQDAMVRATRRALRDADVTLFLVEASDQPDTRDIRLLEQIRKSNSRLVLAVNKIDTVRKESVLPLMERFATDHNITSIIPISALKSYGLDILVQEIAKDLPVGEPLYEADQVTDHPERFIVSELIREKIFQRYGDEIPYAITVDIEEFKERPKAKDFIKAMIYVEKSSQKGILIGKKGAALREVGKAARGEIEKLLGRPVFLELWVKVRKKWRQDERALRELGYG